jgi:RNA polymerase sigma-70 factor (ECF subfamily)
MHRGLWDNRFTKYRQIGSTQLSYHWEHNVQRTPAKTGMIESLYRQYSSSLLLFAAALTGDRSRAQDAVHQVFAKLLEGESLSQAVDAKAYLFVCVRNTILNDIKLRQRDIPLDSENAWFEPPNRDYAAEQVLRRALLELTDEQREVTVLHVWGELTFAEIGRVLGISSNTAASRYRYALANLREKMVTKEGCDARL